jgi:hypothetical protein
MYSCSHSRIDCPFSPKPHCYWYCSSPYFRGSFGFGKIRIAFWVALLTFFALQMQFIHLVIVLASLFSLIRGFMTIRSITAGFVFCAFVRFSHPFAFT